MTTRSRTVVQKATDEFVKTLGHRNASSHTIRAYRGDLDNFAAYAGSRDWKSIDHVAIRGFLSQLYEKGLSKTSVARSLAAVRSLYRWLAQDGVVEEYYKQVINYLAVSKLKVGLLVNFGEDSLKFKRIIL